MRSSIMFSLSSFASSLCLGVSPIKLTEMIGLRFLLPPGHLPPRLMGFSSVF